MKRILTFAIASFIALSCTAKNKEEGLQIPVIKYNPTTYLSDIDRALADPTSFECLSADSHQLSGIDEDILAYISDQDAFIVRLTYGETESAPKVIGIKDKEKGYLKYLHVEEERILYWGQITTAGKCTLNFYSGDELVTVELAAHKLE